MKWTIKGQQIFCTKCKKMPPNGFRAIEKIGYLCYPCRELWFSIREKCLNQAQELFWKTPAEQPTKSEIKKPTNHE